MAPFSELTRGRETSTEETFDFRAAEVEKTKHLCQSPLRSLSSAGLRRPPGVLPHDGQQLDRAALHPCRPVPPSGQPRTQHRGWWYRITSVTV